MFTPAATWRPVKSERDMRSTEGGREWKSGKRSTEVRADWRSCSFNPGCKATESRLAGGGEEEGDTRPDHNRRLSVCVGCGCVFFFFEPSPLNCKHVGQLPLCQSACSTQTRFIGLLRLPSRVSHKTSQDTAQLVVKSHIKCER